MAKRNWQDRTYYIGFYDGKPHLFRDSALPDETVMATSLNRRRMKYQDIRAVKLVPVKTKGKV